MAFYDSVKEDIREENGSAEDADESEEDNMPFDQLKENADDREDPEEAAESGSDSDIEVLGDGEVPEETPGPGGEASSTSQEPESREQEAGSKDSEPSQRAGTEEPELVDLLQRIEEQNQEMLDVLRGIKRSLE
ncbi:MAG: hypothetical protein ABEI07_00680 [Candidatus Nanohaloarchaea archaeon]